MAQAGRMSAAEHTDHWARQKERGSFLLMRFTVAAARLLGRRPLVPLLYLIVLYFYIFTQRADQHPSIPVQPGELGRTPRSAPQPPFGTASVPGVRR